MLSPDFSQPDGLGVVDVDPNSSHYGNIVHSVMMPNKGDDEREWPEIEDGDQVRLGGGRRLSAFRIVTIPVALRGHSEWQPGAIVLLR